MTDFISVCLIRYDLLFSAISDRSSSDSVSHVFDSQHVQLTMIRVSKTITTLLTTLIQDLQDKKQPIYINQTGVGTVCSAS